MILIKRYVYIIAAMLTASSIPAAAQTNNESNVTTGLVQSKHYVFHASTVSPTTGRTRQLTTEYFLKVLGDTVIADLPYFGRAYSAPVGGGIQFTSVDFNYQLTRGKKGRWLVEIKPRNLSQGEELMLTIFENGSATLNVRSNNRQPITFYGNISEK